MWLISKYLLARSHHHHDPELFKVQHSISIQIKPADHGLALLDARRRPQPAQHPLQALWRDAALALVLVHLERRSQIPLPLFLALRLHQLLELLQIQQPVPVGVRHFHESLRLLWGQLLGSGFRHAEHQLGRGDLAVAVLVEEAEDRVEIHDGGRALSCRLN
ncbi:hypothetical protein Cni_G13544 [Canna indica]|uniref:Uncharacterized protein n=1 Tax=Canna indica TaxID=4628 RepID=A0AAQ3KA35_9LILI|nr:hypothetical protein Cni_G13544 [Canna indica]